MSDFNKMYLVFENILIIFVLSAIIGTTDMKRFINYEGGERYEKG